MEQDSQQYLDAAKTGVELAHKTGVLNRLFGLFGSRRSIEQPEQELDYRERALAALQENAVETLATLKLTMQEALKILGPGFSFDDLDRVNPTWQRHWVSAASKVGVEDEDRHTWWGRLVAGEIEKPGTFSLRTLAVMDTLSTVEAQLFTRLCSYVWNPTNPCVIVPTDESRNWKPDFLEGTTLENAGLAKFNSLTGFTITQANATGTMIFHNSTFTISDTTGKSPKLRCGPLLLTEVGKEMFRLTTPDFPQSYCDEIVAEWRETYTVQKVVVDTVKNSRQTETPGQ